MEIKYGDVSLKVSDIKYRRRNRPTHIGLCTLQLAQAAGRTREELLYYITEVQKHLLAFPDITAGYYYLALWRLLLGKNIHDTGLAHMRYYYPIFDEAIRAGARFIELEPQKDSGYYLFAMMQCRAAEARATRAGPEIVQYEPVNDAIFQKRLIILVERCPKVSRRDRLLAFLRSIPVKQKESVKK